MIIKLICASILVTSSASAFAQDSSRASADMFIKLRSTHRCTVTPGAAEPVRADLHNSIPSIPPVVKKNTARSAGNTAWDRIDLQFVASPPSSATDIPTISGFAINTKGTGTSSGRLSAKPQGTVTVSCSGMALAPDDAAQKVAMQDIQILHRSGKQGVGWSCAVGGSEEAPQFVLTLLVPTILGQAERTPSPAERVGREDARLESNSKGLHRVSIVPRGSNGAGISRIACSSGSQKGATGWDVLILS